MASNGRGQLRPHNASRSPPFVLIGLLVVIAILGFNYWNVSAKNALLMKELNGEEEKGKLLEVKRLSLERRNDDLVRQVSEKQVKHDTEMEKLKEVAAQKEADLNRKEKEIDTLKREEESMRIARDELKSELDTCKSDAQTNSQKIAECEDKLKNMEEQCKGDKHCKDAVDASRMMLVKIIGKTLGLQALNVLKQADVDMSGIDFTLFAPAQQQLQPGQGTQSNQGQQGNQLVQNLPLQQQPGASNVNLQPPQGDQQGSMQHLVGPQQQPVGQQQQPVEQQQQPVGQQQQPVGQQEQQQPAQQPVNVLPPSQQTAAANSTQKAELLDVGPPAPNNQLKENDEQAANKTKSDNLVPPDTKIEEKTGDQPDQQSQEKKTDTGEQPKETGDEEQKPHDEKKSEDPDLKPKNDGVPDDPSKNADSEKESKDGAVQYGQAVVPLSQSKTAEPQVKTLTKDTAAQAAAGPPGPIGPPGGKPVQQIAPPGQNQVNDVGDDGGDDDGMAAELEDGQQQEKGEGQEQTNIDADIEAGSDNDKHDEVDAKDDGDYVGNDASPNNDMKFDPNAPMKSLGDDDGDQQDMDQGVEINPRT